MKRGEIRAAIKESGLNVVLEEHSGEFGCLRPTRLTHPENVLEAHPEIELFLEVLERSRVAFPEPENQPSQVVDS